MTSGPLLVLSAAMLLQSPEAGPSAFERRKAVLIEEIEGAAVAEPPVFGIDTQIRAADMLKGADDDHAARFLLDAGQRTLLLPDPATRSHFLKRIVPGLTPLDAKQAESFCAAQTRAEPMAKADPLAICYDQIVTCLKDWPSRKDAFHRALAAGAYDMEGIDELLRDARAQHPSDLAPLLAGFIGAFPAASPRLDEIKRLESVDRKFAVAYPSLSRQARRTVSTARREFIAAHPESAAANPAAPETQRSELAQTVPADAASTDAGANVPSFLKGMLSFAPTSLLAEEDPGLKDLPDTSKLGLEDAIRLAHQQEYAGARAAMLSDILDAKDAQLEPRRKVSLAEDILRDSLKMKLSSSRLFVQAQLVRWFHQQGEKPMAGEAAQALETSFEDFVLCKDQRCEVFQTNADNSPGELIMEFAEYLWKYQIDPAELGLRHPGLRARWRLIELQALLEDNNKKQ